MGLDVILLVTGALKTGVWIFLLAQGVRLPLIRRYPLAYVYLTGKLAAFWVRTVFVFRLGPDNPQYYWIYYCSTIPVDLLALLILLRIYYMPYRPALRRDWPLLAVLPLFIQLSLTQPMFVGHRVSYVIYFYLTSVGALAAWRLKTSPSVWTLPPAPESHRNSDIHFFAQCI